MWSDRDVGHQLPLPTDPVEALRVSLLVDLGDGPPPTDLAERVRTVAPAGTAEDVLDRLLLDLSGLPGFRLAPEAFWRTHLIPLARLAAQDGHRHRLLARPSGMDADQWGALPGVVGLGGWWLTRQGGRCDQLLADLTHEPDTGCLHDPRVSAPAVVREVADLLRLDAAAATLFLQLLALPDPSDDHVLTWNGWTPDQLAEAAGAVESTRVNGEPVVRRAQGNRTGRSLVLPGRMLDHLSGPNLPMEEWKLRGMRISTTTPCPVLSGLVVPLATHGRQFSQAWRRWRQGDRPG